MIIQCPQCQSRFKLPMDKTKAGGTKVRCTKCRSIFVVTAPGTQQADAPEQKAGSGSDVDLAKFQETEQKPSGLSGSGPGEDFFGDDFDAADFFAQGEGDEDFFLNGEPVPETTGEEDGGEPEVSEKSPPEKPPREDSAGQWDFSLDPKTGEPASKDIPSLTLAEVTPPPPPEEPYRDYDLPRVETIGEPQPPSTRTKRSGCGFFWLVLLLILAGGGFFYTRQDLLPEQLKPWEKKAELPTPTESLRPAELSGFHVMNEEEGRLFVVQGEVVNDGSEARAGILVAGIVYAPGGKVIARQTVYCGNPFSRSELRSLPYERMVERMNNQFGEVLSNINIEPKKTIPFAIVFRDAPGQVAEFGVEVIDSKPVVK
jgi:predicted Zn finger-like uncharacterized protein